MKNYYQILRLDPNISERKLLQELSKRLNYYKSKLTGRDDELEFKILKKIEIIKNFEKSLDSYGGKEGYDKALKMSNEKLVNINLYQKKNSKKRKLALVVGAVLAVGVISGAAIYNGQFERLSVPVDAGMSYSDFSEEYDLTPDEIEFFSSYGAEVKVKKSEVEEFKAKMKAHEEAKKVEYFSFDYEVEFNDTISGLASKFNTSQDKVNGGNSNIITGNTIQILTPDKNVADYMQNEYNENHKKPDVAYYYTIEDGDTIDIIEKNTGVSMSDILNFNGLSADDTLYAGSTLAIPKIEMDKTK